MFVVSESTVSDYFVVDILKWFPTKFAEKMASGFSVCCSGML